MVLDGEGRPQSVKYHLIASLLLNEFQKQVALNEAQAVELAALRMLPARVEALEAQRAELAELAARLATLETRGGLASERPPRTAGRHPPADATRSGAP